MCDRRWEEPNYQKLIDPYPECQYDIFMGYERWDNNERRRYPHPSTLKRPPQEKPCLPMEDPCQCPKYPWVNLYVHVLPNTTIEKPKQ